MFREVRFRPLFQPASNTVIWSRLKTLDIEALSPKGNILIGICISSGSEFLRHELNNRFLQSHADRIPPGMSASQLMHYESHQHHHQHLHQHQHQHQHFHSNGAPLSTPQVPQAVVSKCRVGVSHAQGRGEERWVVFCWARFVVILMLTSTLEYSTMDNLIKKMDNQSKTFA